MAEEEKLPTDINGIITYIKKHFAVLLMGVLGVGGTGTGIGFGDTIYYAVLDKVVADLDSVYNIKPLPSILDTNHIARLDSIDNALINFRSYQLGFNNDIAFNDNKIDTVCDGIPMKYDIIDETFHVEWNGYVYTAVKQGKGIWAIYLFQWQLPAGASNYFEIDPLYYDRKLMK